MIGLHHGTEDGVDILRRDMREILTGAGPDNAIRLVLDGALPPEHEIAGARKLVMLETHLVALIPLAAVFLARGFGG